MDEIPVDVNEWIEQPPETAPPWWCLTGPGSRIVVRDYELHSTKWVPILGSERWSVLSTSVPMSAEAAEACGGDLGPIYPGDCVIFRARELHDEWGPILPVRVLHVPEPVDGWCSVLSLYDNNLDRRFIDSPEYDEYNFSVWSVRDRVSYFGPLRGDKRREILNNIHLAVECPVCGDMGRVLLDESTAASLAPHAGVNALVLPAASHAYDCPTCGSIWAVGASGAVIRMGSSRPT